MSATVTEFFRKVSRFPPVLLDGLTYVLLGMIAALNGVLGTDEAAKFIAPATLFFVRMASTVIAAGLLSLKMFRSTTYADYKANGHSEKPTLPDART